MSFIEKVEPYILSDDKALRDFALQTIDYSYLGREQTLFYALEALDKIPPNQITNPILPFTKNTKITENVLLEVIKRMERKDLNHVWYTIMINRCPTELMVKYREQLEKVIEGSEEVLDNMTKIYVMETEALFEKVDEIIHHLNNNDFDFTIYNYGKRVYREIIRREGDDLEQYIQQKFETELEKEYFTASGFFAIFLAGELRLTSFISSLSKLFVRVEEDFLIQQTKDALIKIGTEEVVKEAGPYIQNTDTAFAAIDILKNIKHPLAEELLLRQFEKEKNKEIKTYIADALCFQLSTEAIPLVDKFMEEGYANSVLNLTEAIYPNAVINGVDYPKLDVWKKELLEQDEHWTKFRKDQAVQQAKRERVGRNDPCPCGSGRKYKKCCGA